MLLEPEIERSNTERFNITPNNWHKCICDGILLSAFIILWSVASILSDSCNEFNILYITVIPLVGAEVILCDNNTALFCRMILIFVLQILDNGDIIWLGCLVYVILWMPFEKPLQFPRVLLGWHLLLFNLLIIIVDHRKYYDNNIYDNLYTVFNWLIILSYFINRVWFTLLSYIFYAAVLVADFYIVQCD